MSELRCRKLSWLDHSERITDDRLPKKLSFYRVEDNSHSHKSWHEVVQADLGHVNVGMVTAKTGPGEGATQDYKYLALKEDTCS